MRRANIRAANLKVTSLIGAGALLFGTCAALAQSSSQQQRPPRQPPRTVIIERQGPPPAPRERPVNPPRTYQDISPPMQSPTPLSPMAPRVGG
jgi:hypothetical protein